MEVEDISGSPQDTVVQLVAWLMLCRAVVSSKAACSLRRQLSSAQVSLAKSHSLLVTPKDHVNHWWLARLETSRLRCERSLRQGTFQVSRTLAASGNPNLTLCTSGARLRSLFEALSRTFNACSTAGCAQWSAEMTICSLD